MGSVREEIAKNLLYFRKKEGLTQKALATCLGVNNSAVSNWEKGLNSIDIDTLHKACIALNISINDMFGACSNATEFSFTPTEIDIVCKYRKLDERGKNSVIRALDQEYSYTEDQPHIPDFEQIAKEAQAFKKAMDTATRTKK